MFQGVKLRTKVVSDLEKAGLDLHKRGECFGNRIRSVDLIQDYKFYLAFENSLHCKDYITEKVFRNGFKMGAVPIVWGAAKQDYEAILPPGSYILVEDFATYDQLVQYLNYLDKNNAAYIQYFKWRTNKSTNARSLRDRAFAFCQLCRALHGINVDNKHNPNYEKLKKYIPDFGYPTRSRVVPSLDEWLFNNEPEECLHK